MALPFFIAVGLCHILRNDDASYISLLGLQ